MDEELPKPKNKGGRPRKHPIKIPTGKKGRGRGYKNPNAGRPRIPIVTEDLGDLENKLPTRPIVLDKVLYWMDLGASAEDIAGSFYVSVETLTKKLKELTGLNFLELKEKCCGYSKNKLRCNQFKMSETNASMGIWLGKQWLGQKDEQAISLPGEVYTHFNTIMKQLEEQQQSRKNEEADQKELQNELDINQE